MLQQAALIALGISAHCKRCDRASADMKERQLGLCSPTPEGVYDHLALHRLDGVHHHSLSCGGGVCRPRPNVWHFYDANGSHENAITIVFNYVIPIGFLVGGILFTKW